ncbi:TetR/AcrR family transcriptional regulator [Pseudobacteriovorax antillogorgiicola]|uniref:Transcriptional regulator, TetR family n=1 Tax=Pseudobacteriovorax antillogorgiicola TaxID=1513793 RepID=A0A1Y6B3R5_9BACT|nr:TetR/AcrR family transcriptional regulator [Pseudobacteriovorax antillogorgiicola]TCS59260.1 TetR family transcriptional regulator [Pseudobacteriovorax antillogorgiicola]SME89961.1 transcriptional regulator, TetR family [Pseudobacteriovorax antillogorgiicola]
MSKPDVAAERKDQIVRATVECITKHGYHNFSMQDVARTAGVSKGIIHYYFLNKDDLMMSVLDRVAGDIEGVLAEDMKSIDDPIKKLEIFMSVSFDVVRSTKEYYQVNMDFWTQINQKKEVRQVISRHYAKFRDTCASVISEGVNAGVFKNVDSHIYASFIVSVIDGLSLQWLFDENVFDYDEMIKTAKDMILKGLVS